MLLEIALISFIASFIICWFWTGCFWTIEKDDYGSNKPSPKQISQKELAAQLRIEIKELQQDLREAQEDLREIENSHATTSISNP